MALSGFDGLWSAAMTYTEGVEAILGNPGLCDWEYLLTVEHDNVPPPDGVHGHPFE